MSVFDGIMSTNYVIEYLSVVYLWQKLRHWVSK